MEFLLGVAIGVLLTFIGELISHHFLKEFYKSEMANQLRGLLLAIHDEVEVVWNQYLNAIGSELEKLSDDQPFLGTWRASQDYFTVFNTNASSVGKIENDQLRSSIIKTYTKAKSLIDSLLLNSELNQEMGKASFLCLENNDRPHQLKLNNYREMLKQYAPKLKEGHRELKALVEDLLPKLLKERDGIKK